MSDHPPRTLPDGTRLGLMALLAVVFGVYGAAVSYPEDIRVGLRAILFAPDTLITDYFAIGGIGAAMANAALLTLFATLLYTVTGAEVGGAAIACLFLLMGAALFGKNLINVWPVLGGVWLFCLVMREPFARHINTAFFGGALAPIVSEVLFATTLPDGASVPLGLGVGLLIGFVLPPVAVQLFRIHEGYSLYNMGFVAGVVGSTAVAILMSYGLVPAPVFHWSTDLTARVMPLLLGMFTVMVVAGLCIDRQAVPAFRQMLLLPGQAPSNYFALCGDGAVLINMGLLGLGTTGYVLAIGGDLNGPVIAGILSVVGFGAFGKHLSNCAPVILGAYLATLLKGGDPAAPGILIATLFATCLAPIAGTFGWTWGVLAGAVHISAAQSVGLGQGGLNLYNSGFAAGFVAALIVPVARMFGAGPVEDDKTGKA